MFSTKHKEKRSEILQVLEDMPKFPTHAHPTVTYNGSDAWIGFEARKNGNYSVVLAVDVIEYHIQPINDEGLGKHPLASCGLKPWEFHYVQNSSKSAPWKLLSAKHWVITFKDESHDIVAKELKVIEYSLPAASKIEAVAKYVSDE